MPAESPDSRPTAPPRRLSPEKGAELVGLIELLGGLLILISLASHHVGDPSYLHEVTPPPVEIHNWIGRFGANLSALGFGLLGLPALLLPLLLLAAAWQRLRRAVRPRVVGRGTGALLMLLGLPGLLQLVLGPTPWRGGSFDSGGALGVLTAEQLQARMNLTGALLLLSGVVLIGTALLVQSTLGEILAAWRDRLRGLRESWVLWWARRRDQREKSKLRERVVAKHLQRREDERAEQEMALTERQPAVRVVARSGEGEFSVRRVKGRAAEPPDPVVAASATGEDAPARAPRVRPRPPAEEPAPARARQPELFAPPPPGALPPLNLLQLGEVRSEIDETELVRLGEVIRTRCAEFGVEGTVEGISPGPVITVYEFQPAPGVKVSQIVNLQDDLALALKAESVRIDRIPGRSTLGIEVPNRSRATIRLGHLLEQESFRRSPSVLSMAIGTTIRGEPYYADLATMPHLLVAGATGSGKSVGLQAMITSILYKATREQVQFIFIDPKRIELGVYADIPHLKTEVVVEPKKAANALRWAVAEMERRYRLLAEVHVRSIEFYNRAIRDPEVQQRLSLTEGEASFRPEDFKSLPYYVIVIDELADLMMVAAAEVETSIARLAQMARAVGIHLIVATQRPSVDVLTGTIKANFPCRMSFATASRPDSRTILDQIGAEKLLGKGDMLLMPPGSARLTRLHGAYISEQETAALVRWLKRQGRPELDLSVLEAPEGERAGGGGEASDDELYDEAARLVVAERQASASFLQRRMRVGFSRAARLIDMMERDGLLGPAQGSKPRDVLVKPDYFEELDRVRRE